MDRIPQTKMGKKMDNEFNAELNSKGVTLENVDKLLNEKEQSFKKKIFDLAKMEALVHNDNKLSGIYNKMAENGEERFGYHHNETIMNLLFNKYVLGSKQYLQKYKMAQPVEKKRRDKAGIEKLQRQAGTLPDDNKKDEGEIHNNSLEGVIEEEPLDNNLNADGHGTFDDRSYLDHRINKQYDTMNQEEELEETTSAGGSAGAFGGEPRSDGYSYVGPFGGPRRKELDKPIWSGGKVIGESNYLTDPSGFKKYVQFLKESAYDYINKVNPNDDIYNYFVGVVKKENKLKKNYVHVLKQLSMDEIYVDYKLIDGDVSFEEPAGLNHDGSPAQINDVNFEIESVYLTINNEEYEFTPEALDVLNKDSSILEMELDDELYDEFLEKLLDDKGSSARDYWENSADYYIDRDKDERAEMGESLDNYSIVPMAEDGYVDTYDNQYQAMVKAKEGLEELVNELPEGSEERESLAHSLKLINWEISNMKGDSNLRISEDMGAPMSAYGKTGAEGGDAGLVQFYNQVIKTLNNVMQNIQKGTPEYQELEKNKQSAEARLKELGGQVMEGDVNEHHLDTKEEKIDFILQNAPENKYGDKNTLSSMDDNSIDTIYNELESEMYGPMDNSWSEEDMEGMAPMHEKAQSKKQQRFMGMVHAAQKGELDNPSPEVEKAAKSMKYDDAEDFASTKHDDLPEKVEEDMDESFFSDMDPEDFEYTPEYKMDKDNIDRGTSTPTGLLTQSQLYDLLDDYNNVPDENKENFIRDFLGGNNSTGRNYSKKIGITGFLDYLRTQEDIIEDNYKSVYYDLIGALEDIIEDTEKYKVNTDESIINPDGPSMANGMKGIDGGGGGMSFSSVGGIGEDINEESAKRKKTPGCKDDERPIPGKDPAYVGSCEKKDGSSNTNVNDKHSREGKHNKEFKKYLQKKREKNIKSQFKQHESYGIDLENELMLLKLTERKMKNLKRINEYYLSPQEDTEDSLRRDPEHVLELLNGMNDEFNSLNRKRWELEEKLEQTGDSEYKYQLDSLDKQVDELSKEYEWVEEFAYNHNIKYNQNEDRFEIMEGAIDEDIPVNFFDDNERTMSNSNKQYGSGNYNQNPYATSSGQKIRNSSGDPNYAYSGSRNNEEENLDELSWAGLKSAGKHVGNKVGDAAKNLASKVSTGISNTVDNVSNAIEKEVNDVVRSYHKGNRNAIVGDLEKTAQKFGEKFGRMVAKINAAAQKAGDEPVNPQSLAQTISNAIVRNGNVSLSKYRTEGEELDMEMPFENENKRGNVMKEDKQHPSMTNLDRQKKENKKNFNSDIKNSNTEQEMSQQAKMKAADEWEQVEDNPYAKGEALEKEDLKRTGGEALKNNGNSANESGDEIPKRNYTDDEADTVDTFRYGQEDWRFDLEPDEKYIERMKADMGEDMYKKREKKQKDLEDNVYSTRYEKEVIPVKEGVEDEPVISGKYKASNGLTKFVNFKLSEAKEVSDVNGMTKLNLDGLGNKYSVVRNNSIVENNQMRDFMNSFEFYFNGKNVVKKQVGKQTLIENKNVDNKQRVNEDVEKMKRLFNYDPSKHLDTTSVKKNRNF